MIFLHWLLLCSAICLYSCFIDAVNAMKRMIWYDIMIIPIHRRFKVYFIITTKYSTSFSDSLSWLIKEICLNNLAHWWVSHLVKIILTVSSIKMKYYETTHFQFINLYNYYFLHYRKKILWQEEQSLWGPRKVLNITTECGRRALNITTKVKSFLCSPYWATTFIHVTQKVPQNCYIDVLRADISAWFHPLLPSSTFSHPSMNEHYSLRLLLQHLLKLISLFWFFYSV